MSKNWTPQEDKILWKLKAEGLTHAEIALRMGRPHRAICGRLAREHTHSVRGEQKPTIAKRKCLGCGEDFKSEGPHNRMCVGCKRRAA